MGGISTWLIIYSQRFHTCDDETRRLYVHFDITSVFLYLNVYIFSPFMQCTLLRNVFEKSYHMSNGRDCLHWRIILLWIFHTFKGFENSSYPRKYKNSPSFKEFYNSPFANTSEFPPYLKSFRIPSIFKIVRFSPQF